MAEIVVIEARRTAYDISQLEGRTMTAGDLIDILSSVGPDTPIYFSHDEGYTYGTLRDEDIDIREYYGEDICR